MKLMLKFKVDLVNSVTFSELMGFYSGETFPQIFSAPSGETICHFPKHIRDARMVERCSMSFRVF